MKKYILIIALMSLGFAHSQNEQVLEQEINEKLWKPFRAAFENLDAENLNSLYAEEVLRVTPNGIDTENSFKNGNVRRFSDYKKSDTQLELDFWFDSRHTNADTSYEVGFYKMTLTNSNGAKAIYGQFHIVLKMIEGKWRIIQDWDTDKINGKAISKDDFKKQKPLQFD